MINDGGDWCDNANLLNISIDVINLPLPFLVQLVLFPEFQMAYSKQSKILHLAAVALSGFLKVQAFL